MGKTLIAAAVVCALLGASTMARAQDTTAPPARPTHHRSPALIGLGVGSAVLGAAGGFTFGTLLLVTVADGPSGGAQCGYQIGDVCNPGYDARVAGFTVGTVVSGLALVAGIVAIVYGSWRVQIDTARAGLWLAPTGLLGRF